MNAHSPISEVDQTPTLVDMINERSVLREYYNNSDMPDEVELAVYERLLAVEAAIFRTPSTCLADVVTKLRFGIENDILSDLYDDGTNAAALLRDIDRLQKHSAEPISLDGSDKA